jgi:hypothetical protein
LLRAHGIQEPQTEYVFATPRKWRADYCWPDEKIIIEREGGLWKQGRHTRALGFEADCVKYAEATLRGYCVFRASPEQLKNGVALDWVKRALCGKSIQIEA